MRSMSLMTFVRSSNFSVSSKVVRSGRACYCVVFGV